VGEAARRRITVLICDDHRILSDTLAEVVEQDPDLELTCPPAYVADDAVKLAEKLRPDVVLMDLRMPEMGGIEATRLIKESRPTAQVLMLTTYEGPFPTRSAEQVGAYAYLLKGCSVELILQVISQAWNYGAGLGPDGRGDPGSAGSISPA